MAYKKQTWVDLETPLDAEHMNHIEDGIGSISAAKLNNREMAYALELSDELFTPTSWTGAGWTQTDDGGYAHTVGQAEPLTFPLGFDTGTDVYQITFDIESPTDTGAPDASVAVYPSIGGSDPFALYDGNTGNVTWVSVLKSVNNGNLVFLPCDPGLPIVADGRFDGTIKNISIRRVTSARETNLIFYDENGAINTEMRQTPTARYNIYMGIGSGKNDVNAKGNVGIGNNTLTDTTSGFWNVAIGQRALESNTVGSRNIAIGRVALQENTSGDRNVAIGTFALQKSIGFRNIGIGADAAWNTTSGYKNIAIGTSALGKNVIGKENVAIGDRAMYGENPDGCVAIGVNALTKAIQGDRCIAIGWNAASTQTRFNRCIGIGYHAADYTNSLTDVICIGNYSKATKSKQTVIGSYNTEETLVKGNFIVEGTDGVKRKIIFNTDGSCSWETVTD